MPLNEWVFAPIARAIFSLDSTQTLHKLKTARLSALLRALRLALLFAYGRHQAAGAEARDYLQALTSDQPTDPLQFMQLFGRDMLLACLDGVECSPRLAAYFPEAAGCGPYAAADFSAQPEIVINLKRLMNGFYHAETALRLIEECDTESLWPVWEATSMLVWAYGANPTAEVVNTSNRALNCVQQAHLALQWLRQLRLVGPSVWSIMQPRAFAEIVMTRLQVLVSLVKNHRPNSGSLEAEVFALGQMVQRMEWHQAPSWSDWPLFISLFVRGHRLASSLFQQTATLSTRSQQHLRELLWQFKYSVVLPLLAWVDHAEEEMAIKPGQLASLALEPLVECYAVVQQQVARVINLSPDLTILRDGGFVNQRVMLRRQRNLARQRVLADQSSATAVLYQRMTEDAIAYDYASAGLAYSLPAVREVIQPQAFSSSYLRLASIEQMFNHALQLLPLLNPSLVFAVTQGQPISRQSLPFPELTTSVTIPPEPPPVVSIKALFNGLFHLQQAATDCERLASTQQTLTAQLQFLYQVGLSCDHLRHAGNYFNQCITNLPVRDVWQNGFQLAQTVFDHIRPWAWLLQIDNFPDPQPSVAEVLQVTHPLFLAFERMKTWPTAPLSAQQVEAVRNAAERISSDLVTLLTADSAFKLLFALPALHRFYAEIQALLEEFVVFSGTTLQHHLAALQDEKIANVLVKLDRLETNCSLRPGVLSGPIAALLTRYYRYLLLGLVHDSREYLLLVNSPRVFIQRFQALNCPPHPVQKLSLACLEEQKKALLASQVQYLQTSSTHAVEFARGVIARELTTVAKAQRLVLSKAHYAACLAAEISANEAVLLANIQPNLDMAAQIKPRLSAAVQQFDARNLAAFNQYEAVLTTLQQLHAYVKQQQTHLQCPGGWTVFESQATLAAKSRLLAQLEACTQGDNRSCQACLQQLKQQVQHPEFNKTLLATTTHNAFTWAWLIQRLLQLLEAVWLYQPPARRLSRQFEQRFFSSVQMPPAASNQPLAPAHSI